MIKVYQTPKNYLFSYGYLDEHDHIDRFTILKEISSFMKSQEVKFFQETIFTLYDEIINILENLSVGMLHHLEIEIILDHDNYNHQFKIVYEYTVFDYVNFNDFTKGQMIKSISYIEYKINSFEKPSNEDNFAALFKEPMFEPHDPHKNDIKEKK